MKLENSNNLYKFNNNPFRFIGNTNSGFSNLIRVDLVIIEPIINEISK